MANSVRGEGRTVYRAYNSYPAHLPPRIPTFPCVGSTSLNPSTSSDKGRKNTSYNGSQRQHQRTPSASFLMEEQPSWLDDLLEDTEFPIKKGPHRRSASDSFTFLEAPGSLYKICNIAEEEEFDCNVEAQLSQSSGLYQSNEHQLMSLFSEIKQLQKQQNLPISIAMPSKLCSPQVENNRAKVRGTFTSAAENPSTALESTRMTETSNQGMPRQLGGEPEIRRVVNGETTSQYCTAGESTSVAAIFDPNVDPKQAKRILSNRQSAQRSRVRKLQFIAELERTVNALQAEVLTLSPQVMYLEHQLVHLKVDNNTLKQRVTILLQDIKLKDAQNKILEKDVQKLRKFRQLQLQQQQQKQKYQQPQEQHNGNENEISLPSDFDFQLDQFSKLNLGLSGLPETKLLVSDDFSGLSKNAGEVCL